VHGLRGPPAVWRRVRWPLGQSISQLVYNGHLFLLAHIAEVLAKASRGAICPESVTSGRLTAIFEADTGDMSSSPSSEVARLADVCVTVGTLRWRADPGGGVRGRRISRAGGWTAFVGPTLASSRGPIVAVMSPFDRPTCAWMCWPLLVAVVEFDFSLIVFRTV